MSNIERFNCLSRGFISRKDVMMMLDCEKTKAGKIMSEIRKRMEARGKKYISKYIPANAFLDYMEWSMKEVFDMAKKERELLNMEGGSHGMSNFPMRHVV